MPLERSLACGWEGGVKGSQTLTQAVWPGKVWETLLTTSLSVSFWILFLLQHPWEPQPIQKQEASHPQGCRRGRVRGRDAQQQGGAHQHSLSRTSPRNTTKASLPSLMGWSRAAGCSPSLLHLLLLPSEASDALTDSLGNSRAAVGDSTGEDVLHSQLVRCRTPAALMSPNYKIV